MINDYSWYRLLIQYRGDKLNLAPGMLSNQVKHSVHSRKVLAVSYCVASVGRGDFKIANQETPSRPGRVGKNRFIHTTCVSCPGNSAR